MTGATKTETTTWYYYEGEIKKGMKFCLRKDDQEASARKGDVVTVTKIEWPHSDWEMIRVSNKKFSWRISRTDIEPIT